MKLYVMFVERIQPIENVESVEKTFAKTVILNYTKKQKEKNQNGRR